MEAVIHRKSFLMHKSDCTYQTEGLHRCQIRIREVSNPFIVLINGQLKAIKYIA